MRRKINVWENSRLEYKLYGTEWSAAFRAYGKNEYGIDITEDYDRSIKYDFICMYKVFEHIQEPQNLLKGIYNILDDEGLLYLSIPGYLDILDMPGGDFTIDFENLFHLNHINVFSRQSFKNILLICGFKIIKWNETLRGYTVMCKKILSNSNNEIIKEDYLQVEEILKRQKEAMLLVQKNEFEKALAIYPNYPDAQIGLSVNKDNMKDFGKQQAVLDNGLKACDNHYKIQVQKAKCLMQWDQQKPPEQSFYSNNIQEAEKLLLDRLEKSPSDEVYFFLAIIEARYKHNYDKGVKYLKESLKINPLKYGEVWSNVAFFWKEKELKLGNSKI
jgi:tetratricopeptide (TPR) repeat protein